MATQARRTLSRGVVVETAVAIADADGLDAVSMRRVADALGAGAMSLYNHVRDKEDLLEAMLEHVLAERGAVPSEVGRGTWRSTMLALLTDLRDLLVAHSWATELWNTTFPGEHRKRLMEDVLRVLRLGGFSPRIAHHGFHALDLHVVGYVHQEANFTIGLADPEAAMRGFLADTPRELFPYTVEHVRLHADDAVADDDFAFMLGLLLDGLERHLDG